MIAEKELMAAATTHVPRTSVTGQDGLDIERLMVEYDIDPAEAQAALGALAELRKESEGFPTDDVDAAYGGGMMDGFLLGVEAARAEAKS